MICDAHVHIGYYARKGNSRLAYYSPRRVLGVLKRCDLEHCIVSSTSAQIEGITICDLMTEAREIRRVSGRYAHPFFWLSGRLYDEDRSLSWIDSGMFDGIKLHEGETPWVERRYEDLCRIMEQAERRGLPVLMHSGVVGTMRPKMLMDLAKKFPGVRVDFAHCRPMDEMAEVMDECPNVWTDTAFMAIGDFERLKRYDWHGRLMFGTDLPVWQAYEMCGLTKRYREYVAAFTRTGIDGTQAFRSFVGTTIADSTNTTSVTRHH